MFRDSIEAQAPARTLAVVAHFGQTDKADRPYMEHVQRVADSVAPGCRAIAYLHDVVEDTPVTLEAIREAFGNQIARDVDALTRRKGEQYDVYITRLLDTGSRAAIEVKLADIADHLDHDSGYTLPDSLKRRYIRARARIHEVRGW